MDDKTILLWPDTHIPDQHHRAVDNLLKYVADSPPDEVLFLGDLYDFKPVARWSKDTIAERGEDMQREADAGKAFFTEFRQAFEGPSRIVTGNHEARWNTYLSRYAPGLFGMRDLRLSSVFHFDKFGIDILPQPFPVAPGVIAIHGDRLGPTAGASAMKELRRHGKSIVQGHSHRLGIVYHTTDKRRFAAEFGWLGDQRKASYISYGVADWSLGWGLLTVSGGVATPELIPVQPNGSFTVRGKRYQ